MALEEVFRYSLPGFLASLVLALACALVGVHVVARRLVVVGVALPQTAALGIACSFLLAGAMESHGAGAMGRHEAMALAAELAAVGILALAARGRAGLGSGTLAGVLFAGSSALTILLMTLTPEGLEEVHHLVEGNVLAVHGTDLTRLSIALAPVLVLHALGARRLLFCTFDRETAATLGVRTGAWEAAFFVSLAVVVAAGVHATGTLFVFAYLVLPGAAGIALGRSPAGVTLIAVTVALLSAAAGFERSYAWDAPTGPLCAAAAFAAFLVCAALARVARGRS